MNRKIASFTQPGNAYPGYVNFTRSPDGDLTIIVRSEAKTQQGVYVCRYSSDKYVPGTCTPGDDNCNNYCNAAPQKGPMQNSPKSCDHVRSGEIASLTLSSDEWESLKAQLP